jgi:hypothetical protein
MVICFDSRLRGALRQMTRTAEVTLEQAKLIFAQPD